MKFYNLFVLKCNPFVRVTVRKELKFITITIYEKISNEFFKIFFRCFFKINGRFLDSRRLVVKHKHQKITQYCLLNEK